MLISFIFFSSLLGSFVSSLDYSQTTICPGNMLCTNDCLNCKLCDASTCSLSSNCYCPSKNIPGNIPLADTPLFFSITFDDAVHEFTAYSMLTKLNFWRSNAKLLDKNKCKLRPTMFSQNQFSDFAAISYIDKIGEVSVHAATHTSSFGTTYRKWRNEYMTVYNDIAELAQVIPKGCRAPYLEYNDAYFEVLQHFGLQYDSSSVYFARSYNLGDSKAQKNWWPFTLDHGYPEASIGYTAGVLTKRVPGMWEVPMIGFHYADGKEYEIMDYTISPTFLADFKRDFELNYNSNRAPLGLYFHPSYFINQVDYSSDDLAKLQIYADLLEWVMSHENVLYATPTRIINWIKNPKPFKETILTSDFICPSEEITPENPCNYKLNSFKKFCNIKNIPWNKCQDQCPNGEFEFSICGAQCPDILPGIDRVWKYDGGKMRTYQQNPYYFDSVVPESNKDYYHFKGDVAIELPINGTYDSNTGLFGVGGRFCSKIIISNPSGIEGATGFILTIDGCAANTRLTSTYGYPIQTYTSGSLSGFRMIGHNVEFMRVTATTIGTFCMDVNLNGKNTFKLSDLKAGVDLYNQTLRCDLSGSNTCKVFCGNKIIDSGETSANCPVDVVSRNC